MRDMIAADCDLLVVLKIKSLFWRPPYAKCYIQNTSLERSQGSPKQPRENLLIMVV